MRWYCPLDSRRLGWCWRGMCEWCRSPVPVMLPVASRPVAVNLRSAAMDAITTNPSLVMLALLSVWVAFLAVLLVWPRR